MKRLVLVLLALASIASATTSVTGNLKDLGTTAISSGTWARFYLRGCAGNQPRVGSTAIFPPSGSGVWYKDFSPNSSGLISGTLYSTRDAAGTGNGDIECGGSLTAVWYGMVIFRNGIPGPETPVHAKNGVLLDVTAVTPITTNPVTTAPTGDSTYARLDAGNTPFTGLVAAKGLNGQRTCTSAFYASLAACIADVPAGGVAYIPDNTTLTTTTTITINKNIGILCGNRDTSILKTTAAVALFTGAGTVTSFRADNCTLDGNSTGTSFFTVPDNGGGVVWTEGRYNFENNLIKNWTSWSFSEGQSTFYPYIAHNYFTNNNGDIFTDRYAEPTIEDNTFYLPAVGATNQQIKMVATSKGSIRENTFIGRSTVTAANILIAGSCAGNDTGPIIADNKFGSENENASRYKIQVNGCATKTIYGLRIYGNIFSCGLASMTAISLDSPIGNSSLIGNTFNYCSTLVKDGQPLVAIYDGNDQNLFRGNTAVKRPGYPVTTFTNGGRGFAQGTSEAQQSITQDARWNPRPTEAPELRNRISTNSEDLTTWTTGNTTVSGGSCNQTDPRGGSTACLLTHATSNGDFIQTALTNTGMGTGFLVRFNGKQGTTSDLTAIVYDVTQGAAACVMPITLTASWMEYKRWCGGLTAGNSFRLYFYLDLSGPNSSGNLYVDQVQVADYDGAYLKANGAAASDTTSGQRFTRNIRFGTGAGVTELNGVSTAALGIAGIFGSDSRDTQAASIASTPVYTSAPVGTYRFCYDLRVTQAATTSSSILITQIWNNGTAKTSAFAATTTNTVGDEQGSCSILYSAAGQNISYSTTYASTGGTPMQYSVRVTVERLQQ
jgi:hypothetical protein